MQEWTHDGRSYDEIVAAYGAWSAMAIRLGDGDYTRAPATDFRLKRLVQAAADTVGKPLRDCRVLDLACLEGHYGIEFALHGAEAVCIDIRDANLAKAAYAADRLRLDRLKIYRDDVRNLARKTYGQFNIVLCSGILYHLEAKDAVGLISAIGECCSRIALIDTYVAVRDDARETIDSRIVRGAYYQEHEEEAGAEAKKKDLWASIDNVKSFWLTESALMTALEGAGFTTVGAIRLPSHPSVGFDRRTYLCVKGAPVEILSSEKTAAQQYLEEETEAHGDIHPAMKKRSFAFRAAKKYLPPGIKDAIKPVLRKVGLLEKANDLPWQKSG